MSPRARYTTPLLCSYPGCRETGFYEFETRAEQRETMSHLNRTGWRCVRHTEPDTVLSADNPVRETVLESYETAYGRFWAPPGTQKVGSGFVYGPGFRTFAGDFPSGTRIVVTARLILPEATE